MIRSKRLELVELNVKYAKDLYEVWSDFEVIKYTYIPLMKSLDECVKMINCQIDRTDKSFKDHFVVLLDNKAIGIAGCAALDKEKTAFRLYYQLGQRFWGNGYASECVQAIIKYVFDNYPEAIIKADAVSVNTASLCILRKAGLTEADVLENGFNCNDFKLDLVNFEMAGPGIKQI